MTIKASSAAALIFAAGIACLGTLALATPSFAAEPSPWPTTTGIVAGDSQQAAPGASVNDQTAAPSGATDRSLSAEQPAAAEATDPNATQVMSATSEEGGGWDKASIVGKIFIAAGTLLTLGSAARMFMI
jgi:hypothetical protein